MTRPLRIMSSKSLRETPVLAHVLFLVLAARRKPQRSFRARRPAEGWVQVGSVVRCLASSGPCPGRPRPRGAQELSAARGNPAQGSKHASPHSVVAGTPHPPGAERRSRDSSAPRGRGDNGGLLTCPPPPPVTGRCCPGLLWTLHSSRSSLRSRARTLLHVARLGRAGA